MPIDQADDVISEFGDFIQPFQIEDLGLMGRIVRLDGVLASAFSRQNYPTEVASLLAESMVLTAGLSGIIKFEEWVSTSRSRLLPPTPAFHHHPPPPLPHLPR